MHGRTRCRCLRTGLPEWICVGLLLAAFLAVSPGLAAQDEPPPVPPDTSQKWQDAVPASEDPLVSSDATGARLLELHPLSPPLTGSPRETLRSFTRAAFGGIRYWLKYGDSSPDFVEQRRRIARFAYRTLDLSQVAPARVEDTAQRTTVFLAEVLARVELPDWDTIPGPEEVDAEEIDRWTIPGTEITLERMPDGPHRGEFLFSSHTVERATEFWERVRHLPLRPGTLPASAVDEHVLHAGWMIPRAWTENMPGWARQLVLESPLWKWIASLLLLALGLASFIVLYRLSLPREEDADRWALRAPLLSVLLVLLARAASYLIHEQIGMSGEGYAGIEILTVVIFWIGIAWLILAVGDLVARAVIASPRIQPRSVDAHLIRMATRIVSMAAVFVVVLRAAGELGIPLSATLTGVGVGGIAVALAARPTVENFIGSLTLYADRPVRVGDLCRFGDRLGWVQEIGLRSTRIRTLERTVAIIPNSVFSSEEIVNYTRRDSFLLWTALGLRYETTEDQLRLVLTRLRELMLSHQRVIEKNSRVRFKGFGAYSLDIDLYLYLAADGWLDSLAIREDVLLHIMRIIEEAGAQIAFPSQTTYLGRDNAPDPAAKEAAAEEVRRWVEAGELPFPELAEENKERLRGTLEYPPPASHPPETEPEKD